MMTPKDQTSTWHVEKKLRLGSEAFPRTAQALRFGAFGVNENDVRPSESAPKETAAFLCAE